MGTMRDLIDTMRLSNPEFEDVLDKNPDWVSRVITERYLSDSLLQMAIQRNDIAKCKILLNKGVDLTNQPRHVLLSAFIAYKDKNQPNPIKLLLKHGAAFPEDPRGCKSFISEGLSILFHRNPQMIGTLINHGFDPAACEKTAERSIIGTALRSYDHEPITKCIQQLIKCGCSLVTLENDYEVGKSMLQEACSYGNLQMAKLFIKHGCDVNGQDSEGMTPLMTAILEAQKPFIELLLEHGVDLNIENNRERTALDLALNKSGFKRICSRLKKAGAKTSLELKAEKNSGDQGQATLLLHIHSGEPWSDELIECIGRQSDKVANAWTEIIRHCSENNSAKPSKRWHKKALEWVAIIGREAFLAQLHTSLRLALEKRTHVLNPEELTERYYWIPADEVDPSWTMEQYSQSGCGGDNIDHIISKKNTRVLKGLTWLAAEYSDAETTRFLRQLAEAMYKKVYGVGMRNATLGNAAVLALSLMEGDAGLKEIITLRAAVKYNPALVNINRIFDRLAKERNLDPDQLAAVAVPDLGLTDVGVYCTEMGDYQVRAALKLNGKTEILWTKNSKTQKSVPAVLKPDFKDEIKKLKGLAKDLEVATSAHTQRLEQLYLQEHELSLADWQDQYADHRLLGFLARRLIWQFTLPKKQFNAMYNGEGYVDSRGQIVTFQEDAKVSLWHPISSNVDEVLRWRKQLIDRQLTQPFKQAHREVYVLTEAERKTKDHSLRFANHILKQSQFHALATQRKWRQQRGGSWDGGQENSASKSVPSIGLSVAFGAQGVDSYGTSESGIYQCVATSEVTFYRDKKLNLKDVPEVVFSELMRDVDLFVSVCSVGNDPAWLDREDTYWLSSSFGDLSATAETRKEVLQSLLPKLKISSQAKVEGKFLIVEGELKTYRIHLGSSNIQILPDNRYLCIVGAKPYEKVMLPFIGDHTLSLILSKAFLLAKDHKIKDKSIRSQIQEG